MTLKVGLKTWSSNGLERVQKVAKMGDFIEIMIEPNVDYRYLENVDTQWVVHCGHMHFGFNPTNRKRWPKCEDVLKWAQDGADFLDADKIIVHFGVVENKKMASSVLKNALEFFKDYKDKRILLENSSHVYLHSRTLCSTPDDMKKILKATGYGMCLDMAHAWVAGHKLKMNEKKIIEDFMKIKPKHFHVLNSTSLAEDIHSNFDNGLLDIAFFRDTIKKYCPNATITLETPFNLAKNKKEIKFMKD